MRLSWAVGDIAGKNTQRAAALLALPTPAQAQTTCAMPDFGTRRNVWTGEVTIGSAAGTTLTVRGFISGGATGALTPTTFTLGPKTYTVDAIVVLDATGDDDGDLRFSLTGDLTTAEVAAFRLHVCNTPYDFSAATALINSTYNWAEDLDWSSETTRTVYLSLPANQAATGAPSITGTAKIGQVLTASTTGIANADGLSSSVVYTYQWVRVDADGLSNPVNIPGANADTYTVTAADGGKRVTVTVRFTDDLGNPETRTSAAYPAMGTVDAPPRLASSTVGTSGLSLSLLFDEALAAGAADVPLSAYSVTADGQVVTIAGSGDIADGVVLNFSSGMIIRQGQTVIVSYTDPTRRAAAQDHSKRVDGRGRPCVVNALRAASTHDHRGPEHNTTTLLDEWWGVLLPAGGSGVHDFRINSSEPNPNRLTHYLADAPERTGQRVAGSRRFPAPDTWRAEQ